MSGTIVIGLGNPILGDDGVGWRIAEALLNRLSGSPAVEVDCLAAGGLSLMERIIGYNKAILVDAIFTGQEPVGTIHCFPLENGPEPSGAHLASIHDVTLPIAIQVGRTLGVSLPEQITILAVETQPSYDFSRELSPVVAEAVPGAVAKLLELLQGDKP